MRSLNLTVFSYSLLISLLGLIQMSSYVYGLHADLINTAAQPRFDAPEWIYSLKDRSTGSTLPLPSQLHAATVVTQPPKGVYYPLAPIYDLRQDDWRYRTGVCYTTNYHTTQKSMHLSHLLATQSPSGIGIEPVAYDETTKSYVTKDIEGMTRIPAGVPFAMAINGDESRLVSVCCLHTLDSLSHYHPLSYAPVKEGLDRLYDISFGLDGKDPLYSIDGLLRNMRSKSPSTGLIYDGSYSLASSLENGWGNGIFHPSVQVSSAFAKDRIGEVNRILHDLYEELLPLSITKLEYEALRFRAQDLNVWSLGGLGTTPPSVQGNFSSASGGGRLGRFIGMLQGYWHVDMHDDPTGMTMLVLTFRIPKGSDMGPFLMARTGLYVREETTDGRMRMVLFFKGNDLHTGFAPTVSKEAHDEFLSGLAERLHDITRAVYVVYPNLAGTQRTAPLSVAPVSGLGNDGILLSGVEKTGTRIHTFTQDGEAALGGGYNLKVRLAWENYMQDWNAKAPLGIYPVYQGTHTTFDGENSTRIELPQPPLHPIDDRQKMLKLRGLWKRVKVNANDYLIALTKLSYSIEQERIAAEKENQQAIDGTVPVLHRDTPPPPKIPSTWGGVDIAEARNPIPIFTPVPSDDESSSTVPEDELHEQLADLALSAKSDNTGRESHDVLVLENIKQEVQQYSGGQRRSRRQPGANLFSGQQEPISSSHISSSSRDTRSLSVLSDATLVEHSTPAPTTDSKQKASRSSRKKTSTSEQNSTEAKQANTSLVTEIQQADNAENYVMARVSLILDRRSNPKKKGFFQYKVRWAGYCSDYDDWVAAEDLDANELITRYEVMCSSGTDELCYGLNSTHETFSALQSLLSHDSLEHQVHHMELVSMSFVQRHTNTLDMMKEVDTFQHLEVKLGEAGYHFTNHLGVQICRTLHTSWKMRDELQQEAESVEVLHRALTVIHARSLIYLWRWITIYGPNLANTIFQLSGTEREEEFPDFAPMAGFIELWVKNLPTRVAAKDVKAIEIPSELLPEVLREAAGKPISLPKNVNFRAENRAESVRLIFMEIVNHLVVTPQLSTIDVFFSPKAKASAIPEMVLCRCLVRAALLETLVQVLDDDGILSSADIAPCLSTPWMLFKSETRADIIAKKLLNQSDETLDPLYSWLGTHPDIGEIQELSRSLGEATRRNVEIVQGVMAPGLKRAGKGGAKKTGKHIADPRILVSNPVDPSAPLAKIFPDQSAPKLGFLIVVLKETVAWAENRAETESALRRVLTGTNVHTSSFADTKRQQDHYNPIRHQNQAQTLLELSLTGHMDKLTSVTALSNVLVRLGTGQGERTRAFLTNHLCEWFDTPGPCIQAFEDVARANLVARDKRHEIMQISNAECWGQYCSNLNLDLTKQGHQPDISERINSFFSSKVRDSWLTFLGDMLDQDLTTIAVAAKPTYADAWALGPKLNVQGHIGTTVTSLQLANTLVIFNICQPPDLKTMSDVICDLNRGAMHGLRALGFGLSAKWRDEVYEALKCVYDFLNSALSDEDKVTLHFGVIFVEHVLCKLPRWLQLLDCKRKTSYMEELVAGAKKNEEQGLLIGRVTVDREWLLTQIRQDAERI